VSERHYILVVCIKSFKAAVLHEHDNLFYKFVNVSTALLGMFVFLIVETDFR